MIQTYPYMKDKKFLDEISAIRVQERFAKITLLDFITEKPLKEITGQIISGNLTVDGKSAVRRTCNLSMYASEDTYSFDDVNSIIGVNKKIKLELGYTNTTNYYTEYPIIWFPLGYYVINSPSMTHDATGTTINLKLQDKMCLLNGEIGGSLYASSNYAVADSIDEEGKPTEISLTIYQIIQELVNHIGGEQLSKTIIDVPKRATQVTLFDPEISETTGKYPYLWIKHPAQGSNKYEYELDYSETKPSPKSGYNGPYEKGDVIGYTYTTFIYPKAELTGNVGSSICNLLDNIVGVLKNNYEYYYDVNGNFIFQEIKNYLNTSLATTEINKIENSDYLIDRTSISSVYDFTDSQLISSFSNSPLYNMIKNDYTVWGERKTASGDITVPLRYHLVIDKKPTTGNIYYGVIDEKEVLCPITVNTKSDLPQPGLFEFAYYVKEGTDKGIYKWVYKQITKEDGKKEWIYTYEKQPNLTISRIKTNDWRTEIYLSGITATAAGINVFTNDNYYYVDLKDNWSSMFQLKPNSSTAEDKEYDYEDEWREDYLNHRDSITYFLDFIDTETTLSNFSVSAIGKRSIATSGTDINCVFEVENPSFYFIPQDDDESLNLIKETHKYLLLDDNLTKNITAQGDVYSAFDETRNLLYQYTSYNEAINLSALPFYHLEPNNLITVNDNESGIHGEYVVNTITLPLGINEDMSITATKALKKI